VFMTFHFPESRTNLLIGDATDEYTDCPEYKVSAVRVEPARDHVSGSPTPGRADVVPVAK